MPAHFKLILLLLSTEAAIFSHTTTTTLSPEIINELKDFGNLIPQVVVDELIAKHYIVDGSFRTALKYVRSAQFTQLLQKAQQIPEIIEILDFLHLSTAVAERPQPPHVVATCEKQPQLEALANNEVESQLVHIVLLNGAAAESSSSLLYSYDLGTFSTFVEELIEHLPHDKYVQMINAKRQKSAAFAKFYAALRSVQLRPMVEMAMKSPNLANVIKTLSGNAIDSNSLQPIAFKVISWGPAVLYEK